MAVNKSFVIKNGLEVSTNLIFADAPEGKVGIGTTNPEYLLHIKGGIGVTDSIVTGVSTIGVLNVGTAGTVITATAAGSVGIGTSNPQYKLQVIGGIGVTDSIVTGVSTVLTTLRVGTGGTVLSVLGAGNSIGVGTASPAYLFHINSPVSTGQTALYVQGDVRITGDLVVDDISFDEASLTNLYVSGIGTIVNGVITNLTGTAGTITTLNSTNLTGTSGTITTLNSTNGTITNLTGTSGTITTFNGTNGTITTFNSTNGTITNLTGTSGTITTFNSTNGTITNLTGTSGTITTFNSTNGTITNLTGTSGTITTLNSTNGTITNLTGTAGTITTLNSTNGTITNLTGTSGTITTLNSTNGTITNLTGTAATIGTVKIVSGIITATSGVVTYYGDGQYLNLTSNPSTGIGIGTTGGVVGYGITFLDLKGAGVSTTFYSSSTGIATIFFEGGGGSGTIGIGSTFTALAANGDLFYHIDYGKIFVYYDEVVLGVGGDAYWVDAAPFNVGIITSLSGANVSFSPGSASSPSMYFVGDSQTGFFSPSAGQFTIVSTGSSVLNVNASGIRVTGIATAQDFDALSDENYKKNVITVNDALNKIEQLRGVKFDWKESGLPSYGVIAQELEEVLPELVHGDNPKTVNYNGIIGVLIEAIKEQQKQIEELKNR
jgi:hypothetical protein